MNTEQIKNFIIENIFKVASDVSLYIDNIKRNTGTNKITEFINIAHCVGKYHGYMSCLEEIDIDEFSRIYTLTEDKINKAMNAMEGLYSYYFGLAHELSFLNGKVAGFKSKT